MIGTSGFTFQESFSDARHGASLALRRDGGRTGGSVLWRRRQQQYSQLTFSDANPVNDYANPDAHSVE